jgi:hypothetical protein
LSSFTSIFHVFLFSPTFIQNDEDLGPVILSIKQETLNGRDQFRILVRAISYTVSVLNLYIFFLFFGLKLYQMNDEIILQEEIT